MTSEVAPRRHSGSRKGEVLVAVLPKRLDLDILRAHLWYRVPIDQKDRLIRGRWPPEWLAFYQTQVFGSEGQAINYYGRVVDIGEVTRRELFPDEPLDEKSLRRYFRLRIDELRRLPAPIPSHRFRRIAFITTTWKKLMSASEINDLFDDSPLENAMWAQFRDHAIPAERQFRADVAERTYFLDFAIHCFKGRLDVETDGDTWHANPERAASDNLRDNDLQSEGWSVLRFSTRQIRDELTAYCMPKVIETINEKGGLDDPPLSRLIPQPDLDGAYQMGLFHAAPDNDPSDRD
jgi:very-short-patch-repair endonuclease